MDYNLYQSIIENSFLAFAYHKVILDQENRPYNYLFLEINPAFQKMIGLKASDIIGKQVTEVIPGIKDEDFNYVGICGDIAVNGGTREFERYVSCLKGGYKIKIYSPKKYYFWINMISIEEKHVKADRYKIFPEILKENELYWIIDNLPFSLSILSLEGTILYVNRKGLELFELDKRDIPDRGETFFIWANPEDKKQWVKIVREKKVVNNFETKLKTKSGKYFWAMVSGIIIKYKNNLYILFTQYDITQRKRMEAVLRRSEEEYRLFFDNAAEAIVVFQDGHLKVCNKVASEISGYTMEELLSICFLKIIYPLDRKPVKKNYVKHLKSKNDDYTYSYRLLRKDCNIRWIEMKSIKIKWHGKLATLNFINDITERKQVENALRLSEEKYRIIAEFASDVIWVFNYIKYKFVYISPAVFHMRGFTTEEAMNQSLEDAVTPEFSHILRKILSQRIKAFLKNPEYSNTYIDELRQPCKNGEIIWTEMSTKFRYNSQKEIEIVGVSRNIDERKKAEQQVLHLSYYDQLTGLYNRRFYEEELKRLDKSENYPITLALADVNGLKLTNDAFGHLVGDKLLIRISQILKKECSSNDIIARVGGDEFVILFPKTDLKTSEMIIKRIRESMSFERVHNSILSVSFGLASKNTEDQDITDIFIEAENNMYRYKLSESNSMRNETIKIITNTLYQKCEIERQHSNNVSKTCEAIARAMGMNENDIAELATAGLLHDIGKIGIDSNILNKCDKLTKEEWLDVKRHAEIGFQILKSSSEFSNISKYVLCHHERLDGNGYPRGLKGDEIPLQAKIISIADAYDAMTSQRNYRDSLGKNDAICEIKKNVGSQFDHKIARIFVEKVLKEKWD
ncbi:PAS domain S-box protein [Clostridium sp. BJN0013]|uniref:PAS domain S-box protein n=1 Tax=Clostridium sp. BJN0013 TaxID=3236840 RepID=UPI0034C64433